MGNLDSLFFTVSVKGQRDIAGLSDYISICDSIIQSLNLSIYTLVYYRKEDQGVDFSFVEQLSENLESYVEPVYEDISGLAKENKIVKEK